MIASLAFKSLRNRRFTAALTILSIALAVFLLLGVERIRHESRESFAATVSGTDLLVGARSSPVHLLLSAVFHIGNATNNLRWDSYKAIASRPEVAWTIPLSLGDSHRGYRVLGTTADYYEHLRYGRDRRLQMAQGRLPEGEHDAVIGADVADTLHYRPGDSIVVAHGAGDVSFSLHEQHPFEVTGVLGRTGTPVDRTVHVSLQGLDVMHEDAAADSESDPLLAAMQADSGSGAEPRAITAFLVGLKSRSAVLGMQRAVNEYEREPLTAVMPGVALQEVWEITGAVEKTLFAVSTLVVVVGLGGMLVALLTSLSERRREMAVLRSVGARPSQIFGLILGEAVFLTLLGIVFGVMVLYAGLITGQPWLESRLGLFIVVGWPTAYEVALMGLVALAGGLIGLVPAWRIYRYSLADGMSIRI
ncbi:MAG TPA: ABC transporter permease [Burkholderiales bacterium]|nr:ABC transporter permease [Burkholderiales bacterium]